MRRPSAYWATSSGIAITRRRVSTHPDWPEALRTRLHSSVGVGFSSTSSSAGTGSSGRSVFERSSQSFGRAGGLGIGGGGYFGSRAAVLRDGALTFLGGGGSRFLRGRSTRGVTTWARTSTFSLVLIWRKLGELREGWVWTLSSV